MLNVKQIKAARAILNFDQKELAKRAGISIATLNNIERSIQVKHKRSTIEAIQNTLEKEGISFNNDGGTYSVSFKLKTEDKKILIIDDMQPDRVLYKKWLEKSSNNSFTIIEADDAKKGIDIFLKHNPDCIILDFKLYGTDGFQLLASLKQGNANHPLPPIIFVTGFHHLALENEALSRGVYSYFNKNELTEAMLFTAVSNALKT